MNHYKQMDKTIPKTWDELQCNKDIGCIQDPMYQMPVPIIEFMNMYKELLETFDGTFEDACLGFFFRRSIFDKSILEFVDDESRIIFMEEAIEYNILPSIDEVCQGESQKNKKERGEKPSIYIKPKIELTKEEKEEKILIQKQKTLNKLVEELKYCKSEIHRNKLEAKISKILI